MRARAAETSIVAGILRDVLDGRGGTLVVHGDAGIGKTALVRDALRRFPGLRQLTTAGAEFEMELAFAAVQQLCAPVLDRVDHLPTPQRAALEAALGLRDEGTADPFLVGLAVLGLLADAGHEQPVVCVVDDAQWLDEASAKVLAFVARRIDEEAVAIVFSLRDPASAPLLSGLPQLAVTALGEDDALALLQAELPAPIDPRVTARIVAEARGNPLALIELPRSIGLAELAGGFGLPFAQPVAGRIEESFGRRLAQLPRQTQAMLLVAAVEPLGNPLVLQAALERLGIRPDAAIDAETAGLLDLGPPVRFRHPLVRSAVRRAATPSQLRHAHAALADATDPQREAERRAWHRAQATVLPDADIAAELERCAQRAQARGGPAAAGAFLDRAAALSPDPVSAARRALRAAQALEASGALEAALDLLRRAEAGPLSREEQGAAVLLRARIGLYATRRTGAMTALLDAASQLDPAQRPTAHLEAFAAARWSGRCSDDAPLQAVARAVRASGSTAGATRPRDVLLDAVVSQVADGYVVAVPAMRRALVAFAEPANLSPEDLRWLWLACSVAVDLWDDEAWRTLAELQVTEQRRSGAFTVLPLALTYRAMAQLHEGAFTSAGAEIAEAYAVSAVTGTPGVVNVDVLLAAMRGESDRVARIIEEQTADATARGEGRMLSALDYADAVLHNGLGNYGRALEVALRAQAYDDIGFYSLVPPELVEAAARAGRPDVAAATMEQLTERTTASGTDWALGIERRSRALLTTGPEAEPLYREAIERLERSAARVDLARARLVYGEWLRRGNRRVEARVELRVAHDALARMGAAAFVQRAALELQATGETARRGDVDLLDALTAQELHIARRVAEGATSKEVAAALFLSPRTIEAHLRSIFRKLAITSRRQLRDLDLRDRAAV